MLAFPLTAFPVQSDCLEPRFRGRIKLCFYIRQEQQLFRRQTDGLLNRAVAVYFLFMPGGGVEITGEQACQIPRIAIAEEQLLGGNGTGRIDIQVQARRAGAVSG